MFKQFLMSGAMQFCQIDSGRMAGVNEVIGVYLMAKKLKVPVCPHAGGVGLCEMVQHLQMFDYVALSGTTENRMIEYVDHLHEHFKNPPKMGASWYVNIIRYIIHSVLNSRKKSHLNLTLKIPESGHF